MSAPPERHTADTAENSKNSDCKNVTRFCSRFKFTENCFSVNLKSVPKGCVLKYSFLCYFQPECAMIERRTVSGRMHSDSVG